MVQTVVLVHLEVEVDVVCVREALVLEPVIACSKWTAPVMVPPPLNTDCLDHCEYYRKVNLKHRTQLHNTGLGLLGGNTAVHWHYVDRFLFVQFYIFNHWVRHG